MSASQARLYGLPVMWQTGISPNEIPPVLPLLGSRNSMNSFELNKVLGALLATCLILLSLNIGAGALFAPGKVDKPGYNIAVKEGAGEAAGAAKEAEQPIENLLAAASVEKGE